MPAEARSIDIEALVALLRQMLTKGQVEEALAQVACLLAQMRDQNNELRLRLGKLLRQQFGRKSEKISSEQLSFFLSQLASAEPSDQHPPDLPSAAPVDASGSSQLPSPQPKPRKGHGRKPLPPSLPREEVILPVPEVERTCQSCGQARSLLGYERSEVLEFVPASFKIIVNAREKLVCRMCGEGVAIGPVADKVIDSGLPGPGLLAQVLVSKYRDHLPLTRQIDIFKRSGVELSTSTLADWVAAAADVLKPLAMAILEKALVSHVLQSDDTGLKVLDRDEPHGIKRGHMWIYAGDARWAAFVYTPDWKGEGPQAVLAEREGWLLVDGYAGYNALFQGEEATAVEVGCWCHARRPFLELLEGGDLRAAVPVELIGKLFAIERRASKEGLSPKQRLALRQRESSPIVEQLRLWMAQLLPRENPKSPMAKAINYSVGRWKALCRFLEDGRLPLDNNLSEGLLRPIALGRKNYLFAGSDAGAERAAILYTLLGTCFLNEVEPWMYLRDVLCKLASGWPNRRLDELLPPHVAAQHQSQQQARAGPASDPA